MRGRKPAPAKAETNVIEGPFAGATVILAEPVWLSEFTPDQWQKRQAEIAMLKWREIRDHMAAARTLGAENATAIEVLATAYARWKLAEHLVARLGPLVESPVQGVPVQNPYLSIANAAAKQIVKLEAELGIPPSMRGRVGKVAGTRKARASEAWLAKTKA